MRFKIPSHRGHHECDCESDVAEMLFNKLTGARIEALPESVREKIPDTFSELSLLWESGKMGFIATDPIKEEVIKKFDDGIEEALFFSPIGAG
jgi:hypothetical protein